MAQSSINSVKNPPHRMKFKLSAMTLALSLTLYPATQQAVEITKIDLPDLGDSSGTLISPAEEKEFGAAFFRLYLKLPAIIERAAGKPTSVHPSRTPPIGL